MMRSILAATILATVVWAGATAPWAQARRVVGVQCRRDSDCADPLLCSGHICIEQCVEDRDCTLPNLSVPGIRCRNMNYLRGPDGVIRPTTTLVIVSAPGQTSQGARIETHNVCMLPSNPNWALSRPPVPVLGASTIGAPTPHVLPRTAQPPKPQAVATLLTTERSFSRMGGQALAGRAQTPSPNADLCRNACQGDSECRAYTYLSGGPGASPAGHCTLMATVAAAQDSPIAVSGMKVAVDPAGIGQNLPGHDHSSYATLDPNQCAQTCLAQPRWRDGSGGGCRAWTWVKSGVQGKNGMCWLKSDSGAWQANPDTVAGLGAPQ